MKCKIKSREVMVAEGYMLVVLLQLFKKFKVDSRIYGFWTLKVYV